MRSDLTWSVRAVPAPAPSVETTRAQVDKTVDSLRPLKNLATNTNHKHRPVSIATAEFICITQYGLMYFGT